MDFFERLHRIKSMTWLVLAILAIDAIAMGYGWYYYWQVGQFNPASLYYQHWAWWPLVADSPNAVLLFFVALLANRFFGWRNKWLDASAFILNVYVGLWTSMLFVLYADTMGTWNWGSTNNILFFAHFGMPLQALLLVRDLRHDSFGVKAMLGLGLGATAYMLVDYVWPILHPAPFLHPDDTALHVGSPLLMVASLALFVGLCVRLRRAVHREE